jgi:hypothetical protein
MYNGSPQALSFRYFFAIPNPPALGERPEGREIDAQFLFW